MLRYFGMNRTYSHSRVCTNSSLFKSLSLGFVLKGSVSGLEIQILLRVLTLLFLCVL